MLQILPVDDKVLPRERDWFLIEKYKLSLREAEASNGQIALEYLKSPHADILFDECKNAI